MYLYLPLHRISTGSFTYDYTHTFLQDALDEYYQQYNPTHKWEMGKIISYPQKLIIENDVWVGKDVLLKPGITLHNGCVIGKRSVVTKDVPPYAIVAGNPARIVRYRFCPSVIERLLKLQWWQYHFASFSGIDLDMNIEKYLDILESRIQKNEIQPFIARKVFFNDMAKMS